MARLRLVPARDEPVDRADSALRRDDQRGPARGGADGSVGVRRRLQRPGHRRADRDHAAARATGGVHARGGPRGHGEPLGIGRLADLERGDAGMEREPRHADAAGREGVQQPRREGPSGARHLGAAGHPGEDRLVRGERTRRRLVRIPDRGAVRGEEVEQRPPAEREGRRPEPAAACRAVERRGRPSGKPEPLARAPVDDARAVAAQLDDPAHPVLGAGSERLR